MDGHGTWRPTRRDLLRAGLGWPVAAALAMCYEDPQRPARLGAQPAATGQRTLPPTPACADDDEPTPPAIEGPFYTPHSPRRASLLEPGTAGTKLVLTGRVLSRGCRPVAGALVDFWHADADGEYDNVGYRLRGHQFADGQGRYRLETIVPGRYGGRTRHFHVKVQAPHRPVLTTQLYFPDEPRNRTDPLFNPDLLMTVQDAADGRSASFDFVLDLGEPR